MLTAEKVEYKIVLAKKIPQPIKGKDRQRYLLTEIKRIKKQA
jgi:hypothetical protein